MNFDSFVAYNANGEIQCNEAVPFRLTRNLECFLTPFGVDGPFVCAMCAAAQSIVAEKVNVQTIIESKTCLSKIVSAFRRIEY